MCRAECIRRLLETWVRTSVTRGREHTSATVAVPARVVSAVAIVLGLLGTVGVRFTPAGPRMATTKHLSSRRSAISPTRARPVGTTYIKRISRNLASFYTKVSSRLLRREFLVRLHTSTLCPRPRRRD
jgi:hypothetical protein